MTVYEMRTSTLHVGKTDVADRRAHWASVFANKDFSRASR